MKIEQKEKVFSPVIITLESQDEVDKLFGLFDHINLRKALDIQPWFDKLEKYRSEDYLKYFDIISKLLR